MVNLFIVELIYVKSKANAPASNPIGAPLIHLGRTWGGALYNTDL